MMTSTPTDGARSPQGAQLDPEAVLITEALRYRPAREPDLAAESRAFQRLATALGERPTNAMSAIADEAIGLLGLEGRGSAGISLVEKDPARGVECFRRTAVSGPMAYRIGGTAPRDSSPCGICLDAGTPVLFARPEQQFQYLLSPDTPIVEGLAVPFDVLGRPGGVAWAATHEEGREFDREDARVMTALAAFAAAVHALLESFREAEAANRAKSDFLSLVSHDLRTPLNAIGGYAALLEMEISGPLTPMQSEHVEGIQTNHLQLSSLVDNLLSLSIVESDGATRPAEDVGIREIVTDIRDTFQPLLQARELSLEVDLRFRGSLVARADRHKLIQILSNLLSNAMEFSDRGGRITLSARRDEETVLLEVIDRGVGIPGDELENIFEPFVQLRSGRVMVPGSGLGLAISRKLARAMDGDITVESQPGKGAAFTVSVPAGRA